ncbi:hypothetical protein BOTBODRAFT_175781 [Botryobasidium botryosum FD-172 SS1]|uniref:AMP-dependent synthetase/ligase domain-containing protein n=1 Tax=Botryobasidium botryosum (strain FD-172 SS1) TaxID=930990 RepID=A0A067MMQ9_BOTB1|nr:hypothetical protein BOTBODRAFT_175781 [Botryobasidium botryosum FD-172 SS1]
MASTYPAPPTQQAVNSSTFMPPPIDGSISTSQTIDFHLANNPTYPIFRFAAGDSSKPAYEDILWRDAGQAIHRAARFAQAHIEASPNSTTPPVVVIFASVELLHYCTLAYGALRAGFVVHFISPRRSPAVIPHLFLKTDVTHVLVDESMQGLTDSVVNELKKEAAAIIPTILEVPPFTDLFIENDPRFDALPAMENVNLDTAALIMNSSGSTSFPKAIYFTHRGLVEWSRALWYGDRDLFGDIMGMQAAYPFYGSANLLLVSAFTSGCICAIRSPFGTPTAITPKGLIEEIIATQTTVLSTAPSILELYGGAPLMKDVGTALSASGVHITTGYGTTEVGTVSKFFSGPQPAAEWDYFELSPQVSSYMKPVEGRPGLFELIIISSPTYQLQVHNTEIDGKPAYATGDILLQHSINPKKYKVVGRTDDQLALSTGVKLNPLPVEVRVKASPLVNSALMFGAGKTKLGILIEPVEPVDDTNPEAVSAFREAIWKTVDDASAINGDDRIAKEMILVTKPSKPFLYTEKGSIRRSSVMELYAEEIEAAYAAGDSL